MMGFSLFQELFKNVRTSMITIICVFITALLMSACAGENKNQMSPLAKETGKVAAAGQMDSSATADDQEIICRMTSTTGSRFKRKVCATKAQWAMLDGKNQDKTDEFKREIDRNDRQNTGSVGSDSMGGQTMGMPR